MKKTVLITGASGFLGQALWHYLGNGPREFEVWGADMDQSFRNKRLIACMPRMVLQDLKSTGKFLRSHILRT